MGYNIKDKGNILLVANYESGVGFAWRLMENFWVEIAKHFSRTGRKVFLIYPNITTVPNNIKGSEMTILLHDYGERSRKNRRILKNIITENQITSIYLTDRAYYDIYYLLLRKWGVKSIVLHEHWGGERPIPPIYKRIIKKLIYLLNAITCDVYVGVSRFVYERFITSGCIPREKCHYVLNGIEPIEINERYRCYANDVFNIPYGSVIIVSTGRASFYKGIDFILKCADKLINGQDKRDLYFLYCGDGPDLATFKKMAVDYKLQNKFIFAGKREDIPKILQSCDIGLQASLGEAFSLSILEYMSAGLATVVPAKCGNIEAVSSGVNGILYELGDAENATRILSDLIDNCELRKRLGSNAAKSVREIFNIKRTNAELIALLSDKL